MFHGPYVDTHPVSLPKLRVPSKLVCLSMKRISYIIKRPSKITIKVRDLVDNSITYKYQITETETFPLIYNGIFGRFIQSLIFDVTGVIN